MISFQLTAQRLLYRVDYGLESLGIVHGEVGEDLTVETDVLLGEPADELGVIHTILTSSGVDPLDPQGTEFALLALAVTVSISKSFLVGVLCYGPDILPREEITFGPLENLLAPRPGGD